MKLDQRVVEEQALVLAYEIDYDWASRARRDIPSVQTVRLVVSEIPRSKSRSLTRYKGIFANPCLCPLSQLIHLEPLNGYYRCHVDITSRPPQDLAKGFIPLRQGTEPGVLNELFGLRGGML